MVIKVTDSTVLMDDMCDSSSDVIPLVLYLHCMYGWNSLNTNVVVDEPLAFTQSFIYLLVLNAQVQQDGECTNRGTHTSLLEK